MLEAAVAALGGVGVGALLLLLLLLLVRLAEVAVRGDGAVAAATDDGGRIDDVDVPGDGRLRLLLRLLLWGQPRGESVGVGVGAGTGIDVGVGVGAGAGRAGGYRGAGGAVGGVVVSVGFRGRASTIVQQLVGRRVEDEGILGQEEGVHFGDDGASKGGTPAIKTRGAKQ